MYLAAAFSGFSLTNLADILRCVKNGDDVDASSPEVLLFLEIAAVLNAREVTAATTALTDGSGTAPLTDGSATKGGAAPPAAGSKNERAAPFSAEDVAAVKELSLPGLSREQTMEVAVVFGGGDELSRRRLLTHRGDCGTGCCLGR